MAEKRQRMEEEAGLQNCEEIQSATYTQKNTPSHRFGLGVPRKKKLKKKKERKKEKPKCSKTIVKKKSVQPRREPEILSSIRPTAQDGGIFLPTLQHNLQISSKGKNFFGLLCW